MYVCLHVCMNVCVLQIQKDFLLELSECLRVRKYVCVCVCVCMCVCVCVCKGVGVGRDECV